MDRLDVVRQYVQIGTVGAEIGVWKGDFSKDLIRVLRPSHLFLIDTWKINVSPAYRSSWYGASTRQSVLDNHFRTVLSRYKSNTHVTVYRGTFSAFAGSSQTSHLDWVYIDGDHTYTGCLNDLTVAGKMGVPTIICDDYEEGGWWGRGVIDAVGTFLDSNPSYSKVQYGRQVVLKNVS